MPTNLEKLQAQRLRDQQLLITRQSNIATSRGIQSGVRKRIEAYQGNVASIEQQINSPDYPAELKAAYQQAKATNNFNTFNAAVDQYNVQQKTEAAKFEQQVKDYPEHLQKAYLEGKQKNDLSGFNEAVSAYNTEQKTKLETFEKQINASGYPPELRKAYYTAKESGDLSGFNQAVEKYNANNQAQYEAYQKQSAIAAQQAADKAPKPYTSQQIADMERIMQYLPPADRAAYQDFIDNAKRIASGNVRVGPGGINPEYISKLDYEAIKLRDKVEGTNFLRILNESGVTGLNAATKNYNERIKASVTVWERDVLPLLSPEYQKAYKANDYTTLARLDKEFRNTHTELPDGIWIANSDLKEIDPYMRGILYDKGYAAYESAMAKRDKDLSGIYERQQVKFFKSNAELADYLNSPEAPAELRNAYFETLKARGVDAAVDAYNNAVKSYFALNDKYTAELKAGGYIDKNGLIDTDKYLLDAGEVKHGLASNVAYERLTARLAEENKQVDQYEFNRLWEAEIKKVNQEYKADTLETRTKILEHLGIDGAEVKRARYNADLTGTQRMWQDKTPWDEYKGEKASIAGVSEMTADALLPGFYLARHWGELSNGERALYVVGDALSVLLPLAGVIKAGGAAAREVGFASRAKRLTAALKAGGQVALYEALGPLNIVIHPIASARVTKKWIRGVKELLTDPRRTTDAVITNSSGQIMVETSRFRTPQEAAKAVDELMAKVKSGERLFIETGDVRIELHPGALMSDVGGYSHATTDLTPFEKGLEVKIKEGMPVNEQGLFLATDPTTQYSLRNASDGGAIPISTQASGTAEKVWYYKPEDIARMDADPVREFTFRHAKNMPAELADEIEAIVKKYDGRISGSLNTYVKVPRAPRPNDIDAVFQTPDIARKAQAEIIEAAKKKGFDVMPGTTKRDVSIKRGNKYESIIDCDSIDHHDGMIPQQYIQTPGEINGFKVETLGEQYIRQSYGAVSGSKQAKRTTSVNKMAKVLKKLLEADELTEVRIPGVVIYNGPKTIAAAESTGKLFYAKNPTKLGWVKEAESKLGVKTKTPAVYDSLWFRVGPNDLRMKLMLEKPLTRAQMIKYKLLAISGIEDIKAPFKPAITITKKAGKDLGAHAASMPLSEADARKVISALRRGGNITARQGTNLLSAVRVVNAVGAVKADAGRIRFIDRPETVSPPARTTSTASAPRTTARPMAVTSGATIQPIKYDMRPQWKTDGVRESRPVVSRDRIATAQSVRRKLDIPEERRDMLEAEERRALETRENRPVVSPDRRATSLETRRELGDVPRRGVVKPSGRRVPPTPPDRRPVTPPRPPRVPPNMTPPRVPPTTPDKRVLPEPPERRTPPAPPERTPPPEPPRRTPPPDVPPPPSPPVPPKPPGKGKLPSGKSDKEKRARIAAAKGATTYNMGKLHGKDVWWTKLDNGETIVVLGEKPQGATLTADGKGSAYDTTQRIGSARDFKPYSIRHGAVVSRVTPHKSPKGATAAFRPSGAYPSMRLGKMFVSNINGALGFSRTRPQGKNGVPHFKNRKRGKR